MIELMMDLVEYDSILNTLKIDEGTFNGPHYGYGTDLAKILSDRFEELDMPAHAELLRTGGDHKLHPFRCIHSVGLDPEEFFAAIHHYHIIPGYGSEWLRWRYPELIAIDVKSTLANPILHWKPTR